MRKAAVLVAALLCLAAPLRAETALHRGNRYEPATLDPQQVNTQYENAIVADLFEGLVAFDADGRPTFGIADSWAVGAEGKRYTFHVREGLAWSDGAPLVAEAVVASFRHLMMPKTAARYASLLYMIKNARAVNTGAMPPEMLGVSAPDAHTVIIELEDPTPYFLELLADPFAAVVPVKLIESAGDGWTKPGVMVSNGAFKLQAWNRDDRIVLARNPHFHDAAAVKLDQVNYYPSSDLAAGLARFRTGEFDMQAQFPAGEIDALRAAIPKEVKVDPALLTYYLALNTSIAKLSDPRVRRALSLAIDRPLITERMLRTGELPAYSFVPPTVAGYKPGTVDFVSWNEDQRLTEAARLLKDAGYDAKHPLTVTLNFSASQEYRRLAVVIAGMWKRIGVNTSLNNLEGKVHFADLRQGNYEVGLVAWVADVDDAANFLYVLQSTSTGADYSRYHSSNFDTLMDRAARETDATKRAEILQQAELLAMGDQPIIPLYFGANKNLVAPRVAGWLPNPADVHLSRYISVEKPHG